MFDILGMYSEIKECNVYRMDNFLSNYEYSALDIIRGTKTLDISLPYLIKDFSGLYIIFKGLSKEEIVDTVLNNLDKLSDITDYFYIEDLYEIVNNCIIDKDNYEIECGNNIIYKVKYLNNNKEKTITIKDMIKFLNNNKNKIIECIKLKYNRDYLISTLD